MVTAFQRGLSGPVGMRAVRTIDLMRWNARIERARKKNKRAVVHCFLFGVGMDGMVIATIEGFDLLFSHIHHTVARPDMAVGIGGGICTMMFIAAVFTKPEGRAEAASQLIDSGFENARGSREPITTAALVVLMLIALYGNFAIVESVRRTWVRWRLSGADQAEMARLIAQVSATPLGVPVNYLLKAEQKVGSLRLPVAALMLDGWVVLREGGRVIEQRASGDLVHGWKHPLAEIFGG